MEDLENSLQFYEIYHQHPANRLIHVMTVPIIVITLLSLLQRIDKFLSLAVYMFYAYYYYQLSSYLGANWSIFFGLPCYLSSLIWSYKFSLRTTLITHSLAWGFQVVLGHMIFEGSRPAFLTGIKEAITISPLFVYLELV